MKQKLVLTCLLEKEEGKILAKCSEIDGVATFGNNVGDAIKNLIEAITLYFETAKELGTLDKILKRLMKI
ncbi:MAG: type II toxin-antitoxin system HicB family antitoxin [Clostridia bacterium]|nr:type II toxin-antitoxin system HicB family antitoxin [Clostridia bacterium]